MATFKKASHSKKKQKSTSKSSSARARPASKTSRRNPQSIKAAPQPSWWSRLSAERKLDLLGIVLTFSGLGILLSLASTNRSLVLGGFIQLLGQLFGWGIYVLPIALTALGIWLVLRKIERIPPVSTERVAGIGILFLWILVSLHASVASAENAVTVALTGMGGGLLGALIQRTLWSALGTAGAIIALTAWLTIGLSLALDISVQDLFRWFMPLLRSAQDAVIHWYGKIITRAANPEGNDSAAAGGAFPSGPNATSPAVSNGYTALKPDTGPAQPVVPIPAPTITVSGAGVVHWTLPAIQEILDIGSAPAVNEEFIQQRARLIEDTLASFSAPAQVVEISRGPTITQFGVEPLFVESRFGRTRVRVSKIASLSDDLALALAAPRIRIQAPVPGHSYVGIEVPNEEMTLVALRDILESEHFQRSRKPLSFALGRDVAGHPMTANLETMPHLLIAGTTGSGKSVCVNAILSCMLLHNTPDDLRLVLIDPKRVELTNYNGIPHLLGPVVVEMERVVGALQWMTREMDKRYHSFAQVGARNISDYNARMKLQGGRKLPMLVVFIDELADLMMIAPDETERTITRLAQLARATGIHMVLATQRPSVDVVTGLIKANFPARIAFAVASGVDSRVILDQPGAERLLGRGDMLYQAPDAASPARLQGVFVAELEIQRLVEYWRNQAGGASPYAIAGPSSESIPAGIPLKQAPLWEDITQNEGDPLYSEAVDLIRREGRASVSMLQRRLRIGYTRAARLVDQMEEKGIVGPPEGGTQVRQVLDYGPTAPPREED